MHQGQASKPGNYQLRWENRIETSLALVHYSTNQRLLHCPVSEELFWKECMGLFATPLVLLSLEQWYKEVEVVLCVKYDTQLDTKMLASDWLL